MSDIWPKIVEITIENESDTDSDDCLSRTKWSEGDEVEINNPAHPDHGKHGWIIGFQILAGKSKYSDDEGWIFAQVRLHEGPDDRVFVIPFERLLLL